MNTKESLRALRRANPRTRAGFAEAVEANAEAVRRRIDATPPAPPDPDQGERRRLVRGTLAGASLAAVAVASLAIGSFGGGPGVESAAAAAKRAAKVTAVSADRSGTAVVRITHNAEPWAGTTVRWHGNDVAVSRGAPTRAGKVGAELLVVDGILYGVDPDVEGGWIQFGSPEAIDPDSGTTPGEYLAAVREDTGGATLRRITDGMAAPLTSHLGDGSTV